MILSDDWLFLTTLFQEMTTLLEVRLHFLLIVHPHGYRSLHLVLHILPLEVLLSSSLCFLS